MIRYKQLLLSAGHSSADPGASGNGLVEATWARDFRDLVADQARLLNVKVIEDEDARDRNLPLTTAIKMITGYTLAVEFHLNAGQPLASGCEVLYAQSQLPRLFPVATDLVNTVSGMLDIPNRRLKVDTSTPRKILGFCRNGGLIIETFFVSNKGDVAKFHQRKYDLAKQIAVTLCKYVG